MFADYIEFHLHAEGGIEAEKKITPYLRKIKIWSKKWRDISANQFYQTKKKAGEATPISSRNQNTGSKGIKAPFNLLWQGSQLKKQYIICHEFNSHRRHRYVITHHGI